LKNMDICLPYCIVVMTLFYET